MGLTELRVTFAATPFHAEQNYQKCRIAAKRTKRTLPHFFAAGVAHGSPLSAGRRAEQQQAARKYHCEYQKHLPAKAVAFVRWITQIRVFKRLNEEMSVKSEDHKAEKGYHPDAFRDHSCVGNRILIYHSQSLLTSVYFCICTTVCKGSDLPFDTTAQG